MKAYRTACHLLAYGLRTPLPLGVCEERRRGFVQYNVYITAAVPDVVTLQQYSTSLPDGPAGMAEVMRLVAAYMRRMHDSGLWHRDLVSSNVLLSGPAGQPATSISSTSTARAVYPICQSCCALSTWPVWGGGSGCRSFVRCTASDVFRPRACCGSCACMAAGVPYAGTCAGCSDLYARGCVYNPEISPVRSPR